MIPKDELLKFEKEGFQLIKYEYDENYGKLSAELTRDGEIFQIQIKEFRNRDNCEVSNNRFTHRNMYTSAVITKKLKDYFENHSKRRLLYATDFRKLTVFVSSAFSEPKRIEPLLDEYFFEKRVPDLESFFSQLKEQTFEKEMYDYKREKSAEVIELTESLISPTLQVNGESGEKLIQWLPENKFG